MCKSLDPFFYIFYIGVIVRYAALVNILRFYKDQANCVYKNIFNKY